MKLFLRYISVLLLITMSISSIAQQNTCALKLVEAESLYETGILDSIPSMLRSCINNKAFDDEELSRAYKLLILTYLFEDYQEMAELTMLKFLKAFPEYEFKATDPVEFRYLYNSYQTIPTFSVGVIAGGNYTAARIIEPYGVSNTGDYKGEYNAGLYFQAGLQLKKYITNEIEINLDVIYTGKTFNYSIEQLTSKTIYKENLQMLSFPLSGTYDFSFGNWSPFARVGFNLDYLLQATADFTLDYTDNSLIDLKDTDYEIMNDRNSLNFSALVGAGIKWKFKKGYIMADFRYHYNFTNIVNGENRNDDLKWGKFGYIDDDFTINNFYFSFGYVMPFYRTRKNP